MTNTAPLCQSCRLTPPTRRLRLFEVGLESNALLNHVDVVVCQSCFELKQMNFRRGAAPVRPMPMRSA